MTDQSGPIIGSAVPMEHTTKIAEAKLSIISSIGQPSNLVVKKVQTDYGVFGSCRAKIEMSSSSLSTKDEY